MEKMVSFDAVLFPADERAPHIIRLMTSHPSSLPPGQFGPQSPLSSMTVVPHPEMCMDFIAEGVGVRPWQYHVIEMLDGMNKKFVNPYVLFYPVLSRDGMPFPINKCLKEIQGPNYREHLAWRGNIVIAKYGDQLLSTLVDATMTDFPLLKNYLSTYYSPIVPLLSTLMETTMTASHVTNTSTAESVPIIRSFIHSSSSVAVARSLRGEEAQEFIDVIDQAAAVPELDEKLRKQCLHLLYKMSTDCTMLPSSYALQQGHLCVGVTRGYGGFADVSTGDYLGRRVAIKRLRFWAEDLPDRAFKRFCREIIVWKRLSHPNVLPLLGVSFSVDPYCFIMVSAWMQNGNVIEYTRSNPDANRLQLLSGVMSGASYLHDIGVIHGDLKGANILVDDDGTALLADFGLSMISVDLDTVPLSATAVFSGGTIPWMSPELLFGRNSPPARESDIYALGMVIYEVLVGRSPFHHLAGYTVLIAIQKGDRPRKPTHARSLGFSDRLWGLVVQCWDESPSARPTARDLLRCIQDIFPFWTPPLEYPTPDEEAGPDHISRHEQITVMDAPTSSFFVPLVIMLCAFVLSFH